MAQPEVVRTLKIKTNTLKRLQKELTYYTAEQRKEMARVEAMKAQGSDAHDLRQAENVLAESAMMIPETRQRLEAALSDLNAYLQDNQDAAVEADVVQARDAMAQAALAF